MRKLRTVDDPLKWQRLTLRLPTKLAGKVRLAAAKEGVHVNRYIMSLLKTYAGG